MPELDLQCDLADVANVRQDVMSGVCWVRRRPWYYNAFVYVIAIASAIAVATMLGVVVTCSTRER